MRKLLFLLIILFVSCSSDDKNEEDNNTNPYADYIAPVIETVEVYDILQDQVKAKFAVVSCGDLSTVNGVTYCESIGVNKGTCLFSGFFYTTDLNNLNIYPNGNTFFESDGSMIANHDNTLFLDESWIGVAQDNFGKSNCSNTVVGISTLTPLEPNTTYVVRAFFSNEFASTFGNPLEFTTLPN